MKTYRQCSKTVGWRGERKDGDRKRFARRQDAVDWAGPGGRVGRILRHQQTGQRWHKWSRIQADEAAHVRADDAPSWSPLDASVSRYADPG